MAKVKIGEVYSTTIGEAHITAMVIKIVQYKESTLILVGGNDIGIEESGFLEYWKKVE